MYTLHDLGRGRRHRHLRRLGHSSRLGTTCTWRDRSRPYALPTVAGLGRSAAGSRSLYFWILPLAVVGCSSTKSTYWGPYSGQCSRGSIPSRWSRPTGMAPKPRRPATAAAWVQGRWLVEAEARMALFGNFVGLAYHQRVDHRPALQHHCKLSLSGKKSRGLAIPALAVILLLLLVRLLYTRPLEHVLSVFLALRVLDLRTRDFDLPKLPYCKLLQPLLLARCLGHDLLASPSKYPF